MTEIAKKDEGQAKIRLPLPLKTSIQQLADRNRRTFTMEVVARLERSIETEQVGFGVTQ